MLRPCRSIPRKSKRIDRNLRKNGCQGKEVDGSSNLFSFVVVLYEIARGTLPFRGDTSGVIFNAIVERQPVAPRPFRDGTNFLYFFFPAALAASAAAFNSSSACINACLAFSA